MAIDPVAAAVEAIAAYLETALGANVSKVIRGWPESAEDMDLSDTPVVSVTPPPRGIRVPCSPKSLGSVTVGDVTTHTYRVGWFDFQCQIDLWCGYRDHMDTVGALIETALVGDPPNPPDIRILSTGYHGRPLTLTLGDSAADYDGDTSHKGEWRMSWDVNVSTDVVRTVAHVAITQLDNEVAITDSGVTISETDTVFEP